MKVGTVLVSLLIMSFGVPAAATVDEAPVDQVVDRYLAAIQQRDWTAMASFLDDGSSYRDFTAAALGDPIDLTGAEAIVDFWRESAEASGTQELRYRITKRFTAGPTVVLDAVAQIRARARAWDIGGGGSIEIEAPLVIFVHVRNGKVVHHHDHVDYQTMMDAVARLRAERGRRLPDQRETEG